MEGKVKFFDSTKGFGFITKSDGSDIFVHQTGLLDQIIKDDKVSFDVENGKKGPKAEEINLKFRGSRSE